jgi:hypothetical protein
LRRQTVAHDRKVVRDGMQKPGFGRAFVWAKGNFAEGIVAKGIGRHTLAGAHAGHAAHHRRGR